MSLETALPVLSDKLAEMISAMPGEISKQITEIRLKKCGAAVIALGGGCYFLSENGRLLNHYAKSAYTIGKDEFDFIFRRICNYSLHSAIDSLSKGFITCDGGNRIGVASSAVIKAGEVTAVKDITSLNIRIANEIKDAARPVLNMLYVNALPSIIVASPPAGGKTTFLRDYARLLSSGFNNHYRKVVVIDERNEIAEKQNSVLTADVGVNTDVITYFSKSDGIEMAVRTMSPEVIVCDEISRRREVLAMADGFCSGVKFAVSVHASSFGEMISKPVIKSLVMMNEFEYAVLLKDYTNDFEIVKASDLKSEIIRNNSAEFSVNNNGADSF
ncbi:MAG: hypothetical protein LUH82_00225 [Clostridiales bacterium]|nr:hypothetical protein [Clostridiales bacterium]